MGRTEKINLEEDETLAETVRRFPCLYDKSFVRNDGQKDAIFVVTFLQQLAELNFY